MTQNKEPRILLDLGYMPDIRTDEYGHEDDFGGPERVPLETLIPKTHFYLFDFLKADIKKANELLEEALAESDKNKVDEASEILRRSHPYFALFEANTAGYIDRTLSGIASLKSKNTGPEKVSVFGIGPERYEDLSCQAADDTGTLRSLSDIQRKLRLKIVLLLSDNNKDLASLPGAVRAGLYSLCGQDVSSDPPFFPGFSDIRVRETMPFPESMRIETARMDFDEDYAARFMEGIYEMLEDEEGLPDVIGKIADNAGTDDECMTEVHIEADRLETILDLEVRMMLYEGSRVRKCKRCGEYFVVTDKSDEFCQRIYGDPGKTCYETECINRLKPEVDKIYLRAYKTHHDRIKAGKESKADVDKWREAARKLQEKVFKEEMSPEEYRAVLMKPAKKLIV